MKLMKLSKRRIGLGGVLGVLAVGGFLLGAQPTFAQTCMDDRFPGNLQCTANDVRIAGVVPGSIKDLQGNALTQCVSGQTFSFIATFNVVLGAQTRYDIGLYFATDGDSNHDGALTGTCSANIIRPFNAQTGLGSDKFIQLDGPGNNQANDICGDIDAAHNPQNVTVRVDNVLCQDSDGDGTLNLPNCTSWRQSGANEVCDDVADAFPGSPSKCNCDIGFNLPILVETGTIQVTKDSSPASRPEPGGEFTFTIQVANTAQFTSVTLDRICDDKYGTIVNNTSTACTAGTLGSINSTTCILPQTLAPQGQYSCSFKANFTSNLAPDSSTDVVTVSGHDQNNKPVSGSDSAQVAITNVTPTATVVKSLVDLACADVNYRVRVNNTDSAESLRLTALSDSGFGSITSVHDNVLATTCSVPRDIAAGGNYECDFRAHFCGGSHTDTVTATLNDNDGSTPISPQSNSLTVDVSAVLHP